MHDSQIIIKKYIKNVKTKKIVAFFCRKVNKKTVERRKMCDYTQ